MPVNHRGKLFGGASGRALGVLVWCAAAGAVDRGKLGAGAVDSEAFAVL